MNADQVIRQIVREDGRFRPAAYEFIFSALETTINRLGLRSKDAENERHISGGQLLDGIRHTAIEQFGYLARFVFERWGVRTTDDFGEIVFSLVDHGLLRKRDEDRIEDFHAVYRFDEALDGPALAEVSWPAEDAEESPAADEA